MRAVRLWIKKEGRAKYISHLDMNRCFTRAVRRANLCVWYTEGFNPHPYLNFLTPLSLGQESDGEPLDIRMEDDTDNDEIGRRLNEALPEGVRVVRVEDAVSKAADIAFASYTITFETDDEAAASAFCAAARQAMERGELVAEKMGKQGRHKVAKQIDVCTKVQSFSFSVQGRLAVLQTVLHAGNDMLNPTLLTTALQTALGTDAFVRIRRNTFLKADGTAF